MANLGSYGFGIMQGLSNATRDVVALQGIKQQQEEGQQRKEQGREQMALLRDQFGLSKETAARQEEEFQWRKKQEQELDRPTFSIEQIVANAGFDPGDSPEIAKRLSTLAGSDTKTVLTKRQLLPVAQFIESNDAIKQYLADAKLKGIDTRIDQAKTAIAGTTGELTAGSPEHAQLLTAQKNLADLESERSRIALLNPAEKARQEMELKQKEAFLHGRGVDIQQQQATTLAATQKATETHQIEQNKIARQKLIYDKAHEGNQLEIDKMRVDILGRNATNDAFKAKAELALKLAKSTKQYILDPDTKEKVGEVIIPDPVDFAKQAMALGIPDVKMPAKDYAPDIRKAAESLRAIKDVKERDKRAKVVASLFLAEGFTPKQIRSDTAFAGLREYLEPHLPKESPTQIKQKEEGGKQLPETPAPATLSGPNLLRMQQEAEKQNIQEEGVSQRLAEVERLRRAAIRSRQYGINRPAVQPGVFK